MATRRRIGTLFEPLEPRTYFAGDALTSAALLAVNEKYDSSGTRLWRIPSLLQSMDPAAAAAVTFESGPSGSAQYYVHLLIAASPEWQTSAPTVAIPASAGASTVTGTSTTLSVLGADTAGENTLTYTWSAITVPAGANPAFSIDGSNASKNTTVTFNSAGSYSFLVTISDGSLTTTSSVSLTVSPTLTGIAVTPGNFSLNLSGTRALTATASDQFGAALTVQPTFTWNNTGIGSVSASGLYSAGTSAGVGSITASASGVSGTATATVNNAPPTVAIPSSAGASTVTGASTTLSVLGGDDAGANALTYTWSAISAPGGANPTFSINGTNTAKLTTVTFNKAGSYSFLVTISDGTLTTSSSVTLTVVHTLTGITITPGSIGVNLNGTHTFTAVASDQFGAALTTQPTFTWSNIGKGSISAAGLYSAGASAGTATLTASAGGVSGNANVTVTNAAPTVATPAGAGALTLTGNSTTLSVLGADDAGENALTYTWSVITDPSGANPSFSINGSNSSKNTAVTFDKAGSYSFLVTISDGSNSVSSSIALTVNQTLTSIVVTPAAPSLHLNQNQTFSAVGDDQFGVTLAVQPTFTWTKTSGVGTISGAGVYSSGSSAGAAVITASSGGISGSSTASITDAAPSIASIAAAGATTVTTNSTTLSVLGADDGGENNLTYTWSATTVPAGGTATFSINATNAAKAITVTFNKAGSYTFLVTVSDGSHTVTSSVSLIVAQTLTAIVVTPGTRSLNLNQSQTFSAVGDDQFGALMTVQPTFTWTMASGVGSMNASGVYNSGGGAGSASIRATSGSVFGASAITVTNAAPTLPSPAAPTAQTPTTATLAVLGADDGGESNLTYSWTTITAPTGAAPAFSINGTNAAKNMVVTFDRAGSYTFRVTISDGSNTVTSDVTLTVNPVDSLLIVSPGTPSLSASATQQFSAIAYDQFGQALTVQPAFTWSIDSGGGTISAGGLFTAPAAAGTVTVRATATGGGGGVYATASATITSTGGNPVTVSTRNLTGFTELVITGTSGNDSIYVTQSGNTFTILSNGTTQTITGPFGDLKIYAGNGGSAITVDSSVTINNMIYSGATGFDAIVDHAAASYNAIITVGGSGADNLTGNGVNTNYWCATTDTVNASAAETNGGYVNKISQFLQPFSTDPNNANYIPLQLQGQNLPLPTDAGSTYTVGNGSFFGLGPLPTDLNQGPINDCFLMADLSAVAGTSPNQLYSMAVDLGDGTYAVRFTRAWLGGSVNYVRVDGRLSGQGGTLGNSNNLWGLIIEKAYVCFHSAENGSAIAYSSLNYGQSIPTFKDLGFATSNVTIGSYTSDAFGTLLSNDLQAGLPVTCATTATVGSGWVASHVYSLASVTYTEGQWMYTVRNPWGSGGVNGDGLMTVTYSDLIANAPGIAVAE